MFSIVDCTVLKEDDEFAISASINEMLGSLELECNIPKDRKVGFQLHSGAKNNLMNRQLFGSGEKVEIELQAHKADSFTLEVSDENGNAMSRYRIMRSFC